MLPVLESFGRVQGVCVDMAVSRSMHVVYVYCDLETFVVFGERASLFTVGLGWIF